MKLTVIELKQVNGGGITSSFINAISKGVKTFMDLGRSLGSSIRRLVNGSVCPI